MNKLWFEMADIRKRRLKDAVWIPLRCSLNLVKEGTYGYLGYKEEFYGLGSVAFPVDKRNEISELSWTDIGIGHSQRVWANKEHYKPADIYQYHDGIDLGIDLVLVQEFDGSEPDEWHLNQDLVFALHLLREGDDWICPSHNYEVVARLQRDEGKLPVLLEVKNEFLRDYLCARNMFLKTCMYRNRDAVVEKVEDAGSPNETQVSNNSERYECRVIPIIEGGHSGDGAYAVFQIGRTDVDFDEDVPQLGPETDSNTSARSWKGHHEGRPLVHISGELWRDEEIEPALQSTRVRGDDVPTGIQYITDASGTCTPSEALDNEDIRQWLWFQPQVILTLANRRGGHFRWYTQETGGVRCSPGSLTHFGLNGVGVVTVYAYDIAKLPLWQQRIWSGYNIPPEGGVSKELLSAQMGGVAANTTAPEQALFEILEELDRLFIKVIGTPLFRAHSATDDLCKSISRFRALDLSGLLSLSKDLMRLIAERIDSAALQKVVPPPKGEKWGSLKSLEKYLGTIISPENARLVVGPLVGAYDLRGGDAHLPGASLAEAYELARIDPKKSRLEQGFTLIASVASALLQVCRVMKMHLEG